MKKVFVYFMVIFLIFLSFLSFSFLSFCIKECKEAYKMGYFLGLNSGKVPSLGFDYYPERKVGEKFVYVGIGNEKNIGWWKGIYGEIKREKPWWSEKVKGEK